jgi:short-subunit dehydrogenase
MNTSFLDKVAIVTGASRGIGEAVSRRLVAHGARVALVARSVDALASLAAQLGSERAAVFALDVTNRSALCALPGQVASRFGRLDYVVNNAGVNHRGAVRERSAHELASILESNLVAPILLTHAALAVLSSDGVIVNVASLAGKVPLPHEATYSASKFGLRAFARALDMELAHDATQIRVTSVCPGPVDTAFFGDDLGKVPDMVFSQPLSSADDIADAVLRALRGEQQEVSVPALSGKLATLGYLSPRAYAALRPLLERIGARNKRRYLQARAAGGFTRP